MTEGRNLEQRLPQRLERPRGQIIWEPVVLGQSLQFRRWRERLLPGRRIGEFIGLRPLRHLLQGVAAAGGAVDGGHALGKAISADVAATG